MDIAGGNSLKIPELVSLAREFVVWGILRSLLGESQHSP